MRNIVLMRLLCLSIVNYRTNLAVLNSPLIKSSYALFFCILASCGGNPKTQDYSIEFIHPTNYASLSGSNSSVQVRGTLKNGANRLTSTPQGSSLTVNGLEVNFDNNRNDWLVDVPINHQQQKIQATLTLADGTKISEEISIDNSVFRAKPNKIVIDTNSSDLYELSFVSETLTKINIQDQSTSVLASPEQGEGTNLGFSYKLLFDDRNHRLIAIETPGGSLLSVDLTSGDRQVIGSMKLQGLRAVAGAAYISDKNSIIFNDWDGTFYEYDLDAKTQKELLWSTDVRVDQLTYVESKRSLYGIKSDDLVFEVKLDENQINFISENQSGSETNFERVTGLQFLASENALVTLDYEKQHLVKINLDNGNRSLIANSDGRQSTPLKGAELFIVDERNDSLLVYDSYYADYIKVDLSSGDSERLLSLNKTTGNEFLRSPSQSTFHDNKLFIADKHDIKVYDFKNNALKSHEINSFNSSDSLNERFANFIDSFIIESDDKLIVNGGNKKNIYSVDLKNRNTQLLSAGSENSEKNPGPSDRFIYDRTNQRIITSVDDLFRDTGAIVSVDLASGERKALSVSSEKFSSIEVGSGTSLENIRDIAYDSGRNWVYATTRSIDLIKIDLNNNGRRSIVMRPAGLNFDTRTIALVGDTLYVADELTNNLLSINLNTLDYKVVSEAQANDLSFSRVEKLSLDVENQRAFITYWLFYSGLIQTIDLVTGERSILTQ